MTRTLPLVLILAFALSACGNDLGEGNGNAGAPEAAAAAAARPADAPPSGTAPGAKPAGAAPAAQPAGAARMPLQPLSEEDMMSSDQMGCSCMFDSRNSRYLFAIGDELMVRTAAGRQVCRITDAQFQSLGETDTDVPCGGVRMSIRQTGPRDLNVEADSSSAPAILSTTQDGVTGTLEGDWGCAC